jgi:hypothetical protein
MLQAPEFIQDHLYAKARVKETEGGVVRQRGIGIMQPGQKSSFVRKDFDALSGHFRLGMTTVASSRLLVKAESPYRF